MTHDLVSTIMLAVLTLASLGCLGVGWWLLLMNRTYAKRTIISMHGLADTYKLGFEALAVDNKHLAERLTQIEFKLGIRPRSVNE